MGFNLKNVFQGHATTCSPERIKKWEYFAANIAWVFNRHSEVVHLLHGFKNEGKKYGENRKRELHSLKNSHSSQVILFYIILRRLPTHIRMANMQTEKHKLTGREQNRPLHWPFFLKLWPWPLEEKGKKKKVIWFSSKDSSLVIA